MGLASTSLECCLTHRLADQLFKNTLGSAQRRKASQQCVFHVTLVPFSPLLPISTKAAFQPTKRSLGPFQCLKARSPSNQKKKMSLKTLETCSTQSTRCKQSQNFVRNLIKLQNCSTCPECSNMCVCCCKYIGLGLRDASSSLTCSRIWFSATKSNRKSTISYELFIINQFEK